MSKIVHVEINESGLIIRIFRNKDWLNCPEDRLRELSKAEAVGGIRKQVFRRAYNPLTGQFECEKCGRVITWTNGEMHEVIPKGSGGEVSLENCVAICHDCHTGGPDAAHADRRWQSAKIKPKEGQDGTI